MTPGLRSVFRTALAIIAWGALHSLLATRKAKQLPVCVLGVDLRNATYRLAYNGVAAISTAALLLYVRALPDRRIYAVRGGWRVPLYVAQSLLLVTAIAAALQIGFGPFSGVTAAYEFLRGHHPVPEEPEAQGPSLEPTGHGIAWPFRFTRHPLNFAFSALLFLLPEMTAVRITVALATLLYALLGSKLEENRLSLRYGDPYKGYRESGVPFFFPHWKPVKMPAAFLPARSQTTPVELNSSWLR